MKESGRDPQVELLEASDRRILVVGGPGAGKTATSLLKARAYLDAQRRPVLFLTFSRTAIGEIASRAPGVLSGDAVERLELSTFHGFAASLLNAFGRYAGRGDQPIEVITDEEFEIGVGPASGVRFREIIPAATELLRSWPWLVDKYQSRYAAVFADEYQDTGDAASALLDLLAEMTQLVCLADERQMIYDWQNEGQRARVAAFRATPHREIDLGDRSFRDPSRMMPRLAEALQEERFDDPVIQEALSAGRFRVVQRSPDTLADATVEIAACREAGATDVGIFVSQKLVVDELAERLRAAGIEHEIAGLQGASGEAQVAAAALGQFAAGRGTWESFMQRVGVFHAASAARKAYDLARQMAHRPETLPVRMAASFDAIRAEFDGAGSTTLGGFLESIRPLWRGIFLGRGARLWETGIDDLRGQLLASTDIRLADGAADVLDEVARRRRNAGALDNVWRPPASVRVMTRHQAKGREMDAILLVHHAVDFEPFQADRRESEHRLIYVAVSRARRMARVILRPDPIPMFQPYERWTDVAVGQEDHEA